jgi:hypothetical protein
MEKLGYTDPVRNEAVLLTVADFGSCVAYSAALQPLNCRGHWFEFP